MSGDDADSLVAPRSRGAAPSDRGRRAAERRGQLKIFLGYASGVGKSFRLFDEGRRRRERGEDVVVAAMQPDVAARGRASSIRRPRDRFRRATSAACRSSTCPPSSRAIRRSASSTAWPTTTRRAAGIASATRTSRSCSSRHFGAHVDQSRVHRRAAGIRSRASWARRRRETVPQEFIDRADEVVVVDAPPEADDAAHRARTSCRSCASARCC